ncbi:hypothetical protein Tco_0432637 [Tanacetum coccineum]
MVSRAVLMKSGLVSVNTARQVNAAHTKSKVNAVDLCIPISDISDETIANPNAQIVGDDMVRVQVPKCMAWLDYDEHVDSLCTMDNEVEVTSPESTTQTLPLFEEYTPPVTYLEEVEKTLGTLIEVEPLNETKLEEVRLNCNHNTPFSSTEVPSFDELEPQPLLNSPSLDASLGYVISPEPPIKPHSLDSSRMKVVDYLTTHTPPSPHVANSYPKCVYSYYNPGIDDPKRHYGLKPGLLEKSVSLGVDISNWKMFDDDWGFESKEVSPLGEELSLFDRPNKVERGRILEAHHLESILQQQIFQHMALSHHNVIAYGECLRLSFCNRYTKTDNNSTPSNKPLTKSRIRHRDTTGLSSKNIKLKIQLQAMGQHAQYAIEKDEGMKEVEETYHVTFDESMKAIRFTNSSVDEIGIDNSSRYQPNEYIHEVLDMTQSLIIHYASTSSNPIPQDKRSRDQHIELVNIIGKPTKGMLTRSMAAKLIAASASECLFADFLFEIKPKRVTEALKHSGWVDAMQKELN